MRVEVSRDERGEQDVARLQPDEDGEVRRVRRVRDGDTLVVRERLGRALVGVRLEVGGVRLGVRVVKVVRDLLRRLVRELGDGRLALDKVGREEVLEEGRGGGQEGLGRPKLAAELGEVETGVVRGLVAGRRCRGSMRQLCTALL